MGVVHWYLVVTFVVLVSPSSATFTRTDGLGPTPKMLGILKKLNPFSIFLLQQKHIPKTPKAACNAIGGVYVEPECLEYFTNELNFVDARMFCVNRGGDLWVPTIYDLKHPFLYQNLLVEFPELFKGSNPAFWIGIARSDSTGFTGVDGTDVSTTSLVRVNDEASPTRLCAYLSYAGGHLQFDANDCLGTVFPFVCEYPLRFKTVNRYKPSFFNKFW